MKKLTVIDLFCGAGGFSEGFRQQGYQIVAGYDNWKPAIDTFNYNFGTVSKVKNILDFKDSIDEIDSLPNTDVIIGSPPCVSFSSSNISGKADKVSGILLTKVFLRIVAVKKYQPNSKLKAWFMENVGNSRNYLPDYYTFNDLGLGHWAKKYRLSPTKKAIVLKDNQPLINSADYGSYQSRIRAISGEIIKVKKLIIPKPTHSKEGLNGLKKWNTLGDLLNSIPAPHKYIKDMIITDPLYPKIRITSNQLTDHFYDSGLYKSEWEQSRFLKTNHPYMGKMSFPENLDRPSRTITATRSGSSREAIIYKSGYHREGNGEYRIPTVREAASIMGFPFSFQFTGSLNTKWRLVGNAVCPSVSRAFANQLDVELGRNTSKMSNLKIIFDTNNIENLNTFSEKIFNNQPKRNKNSRFRRHTIKDGNLTVTLSNYDISNNSKSKGKWFTSIQYGSGEGFPIQSIKDGYYKKIESIISKYKEGLHFLETFNNKFSEKIGSSKEMQDLYEFQIDSCKLYEPTVLVEELKVILDNINLEESLFRQNNKEIFNNKEIVPVKQIFALYAINKISSIANAKI